MVVPSYDAQTQTWSVNAANAYTYTPFGGFYEGQCVENIGNPFKITGQWHDAEIDQYYLRARMYDPAMMRFTARDPIRGKLFEPMTLHRYLYCNNSPSNYVDPSGKILGFAASLLMRGKNAAASYAAKEAGKQSVYLGVSIVNGLTQGYINMFFGPSDVSDSAKFMIGFAGGYLEMQVGLRTHSATAGATASALFMSAANAGASKSTDFLSMGTVFNLGFAALAGGIGDIAGEGALTALHFWAIGVDATLGSTVFTSAWEATYGD